MQKVGLFNFFNQIKILNILYDCGKYMSQKYNLNHWNNSYLKNLIIILICEIKNSVYIVKNEKNIPIATFQLNRKGAVLRFEKLATSPEVSGRGIGSFCVDYIERMAKELGCNKVCMKVYSQSEHARLFYEHRGYQFSGITVTLKYSMIKMEKIL
ncbi:MAG: GNAT family N-acetyltransferase [Limisphaerales bacterium]